MLRIIGFKAHEKRSETLRCLGLLEVAVDSAYVTIRKHPFPLQGAETDGAFIFTHPQWAEQCQRTPEGEYVAIFTILKPTIGGQEGLVLIEPESDCFRMDKRGQLWLQTEQVWIDRYFLRQEGDRAQLLRLLRIFAERFAIKL
jgi:hypothetical protein